MTDKKSILLKLSIEEVYTLESLAKEYGYSKSALLRRALNLYKLIDKEKPNNAEFGVKKDGTFYKIKLWFTIQRVEYIQSLTGF